MKLPSKKRIIIEFSLIALWFILRYTLESYYSIDIPFYISLVVIFSILLFAQNVLEKLKIKWMNSPRWAKQTSQTGSSG